MWIVHHAARVHEVVLVEQRLVHQVLKAAVLDEHDVVIDLWSRAQPGTTNATTPALGIIISMGFVSTSPNTTA